MANAFKFKVCPFDFKTDCDRAYEGTGVKVLVGTEDGGTGAGKDGGGGCGEGDEECKRVEEEEAPTLGYTTGIQRWRVPATDIYT